MEALGVNRLAFGVGDGASLDRLQEIDGRATAYPSVEELLLAFRGLGSLGSSFGPEIASPISTSSNSALGTEVAQLVPGLAASLQNSDEVLQRDAVFAEVDTMGVI